MPNDKPKVSNGMVITGPTDMGANALGFGERTGFSNELPEARPLAQIESEGLSTPVPNDYDAFVGPPAQTSYDTIVADDKDDQKKALQQSFFVAQNDDPDKMAKVVDLSKRLNLPSSFVQKNYDSLSKTTPSSNDYDTIIQKTPGLAKWLQDPDNATLGKDDLDNLGKVDQASGFYSQAKAFPEELRQAAQGGLSSVTASSLLLAKVFGFADPEPEAIANWNKQSQELSARAPDYVKQFQDILTERGGDLNAAKNQFIEGFKDIHDSEILKALKDFGSGGIKSVGDTLAYLSALPANPRASLYTLSNMTPLGLAAIFGGQAGATAGLIGGPAAPFTVPAGALTGSAITNIALMTGMELNSMLTKMGVDITDPESLRSAFANPEIMSQLKERAPKYGITSGLVQTLFQAFGGRFLAGPEAGLASKAIGLAKEGVVQSTGMGVADISGQAVQNKPEGIDLSQSLNQSAFTLAHSFGSSAIGLGKSMRGELHPETIEATKEITTQAQEAMQVHGDVQSLTELGQAVKESKLGARSPDKMADLVEQSSPDSKVYFQTDDWDKFWSGKGVSPVEAAQAILGDAAPYHEAKTTGGSLEIPLSDFASKVGPTENYDALLPFVRSEPDGMTMKESDEFMKNLPATMEELSKEATQNPAQQSVDEIKENVKQQLMETGTLPKDADKQAELYSAFFKSIAERTGQDPKALFDQYQLKIGRPKTGESAPILGPEEHVLEQGRLIDASDAFGKNRKVQESLPDGYSVVRTDSILDKGFDPIKEKYSVKDPEGRISGLAHSRESAVSDFQRLVNKYGTNEQKLTEDSKFGPQSQNKRIQETAQIQTAIDESDAEKTPAARLDQFKVRFGEDKFALKAIDSAQNSEKGPYVKNKKIPGMGFSPNFESKPTGVIGKPEIQHQVRFGEEPDPLAWLDRKYGATKDLIEKHAEQGIPLTINTSSDLIGTNEYIGELPKDTTVNMYLTTRDDKINQILFPSNPSRVRQEEAIKHLRSDGIKVNAIEPTLKDIFKAVPEQEAQKLLDAHIEGKDLRESTRSIISKALKSPFEIIQGGKTLFQEPLKSEFKEVEPSEYIKARDLSSRSQFLTPYTAEELKDYRLFLNKEGVGYALSPSGDMIGVFNNSSTPGAGREAIVHGISNGAKTLDAIGGYLPEYYNQFGFVEEKRLPWEDKYAPKGWNYEKYGRPEIVFLRYPESLSRDPKAIRQRSEIARDQLARSPNQEGESHVFPERDGQIDWEAWGRLDQAAQSEALRRAGIDSESVKFQQDETGPRGQIRFGNNNSFNIDLLKNADMSTFLHETGHFYLEVLRDISNSEKATDQIKNDFRTIQDWVGAKEGEALTTEQHEQFARGFEAYLMEGKAPSSALRKAFDSFKLWLTNIYSSIKNLNVDLTPEVRQVFDRLLASEDEIKDTEVKQNMDPLFPDPIKAGMSQSQADRYIKARDAAREASVNELSNKLLDDVRKKSTSAYKSKEASVREEVTNQIDETNLYKAINQLQGKEVRLDIPELKLSKEEVIEKYGKEFIKKLPKGIWAKKGEGSSLDIAAELLNFHSGDDMLTQFANSPDRKTAIEAGTQARMQDENPDLLTSDALPNAAMEAVHNDKQAELLRMELEHLASNNMPVLKDVIRKVARRVPTEKAVRDQADQMIGNKNIEDAKPYLFERAERKAAKEAGELLAKGDIDGAFQAKQKELLNHELWKSANNAEQDIDSSLKRFKKLAQSDEDLSKSRDTDLVNAARSLLSMYDVGKFGESDPESFLKKIKAYDEETYYTIKSLLDPLTEDPKPYDQLTYGEFSHLKDTVDALWSLSRSQKQMLIDGQRMSRDEVMAQLSNRLSEVDGPKERATYEKAKDGWDKTKMVLLGIKAALTRVEHWAAALDKDSIDGPFQKYLVRPIMEGITEYRTQKDLTLKEVEEIISPFKDSLGKKSPIRSDELGYEFSGKAELLGALLHTGNESNLDKLLRGNGWEKEKWDNFISRMIKEGKLGKADYDTVQKIWDLFEKIKPAAQKAHKEMYGFHFNEITNQEFTTPFGEYKGGYAPAIADPLRAPDAQIRNEKELLEKFNNSWMFPTTGRGFTKGRVQEYAAPLMMDMRLIASHIDKVLRFVNIEPRVKDASKIVMNREFRKVLDAHDPTVGGSLLVPWLQRSAQQRMNTPSQGWDGKGSDIFFRELRTRSGLNSLVGNLGHILHVATTGIPTGLVLVDAAKMRDSLWSYMKAPKDTVEAVTEKSDFMKNRMNHQTSQIMESIDEIILNPTKLQKAQSLATKYGYYIQQSIMNQSDSVIWNAAYNQAIEKGLSEKLAVAESDSVIRRTQHASNPEDVSRFETGTPFVRFFTQFVSYFNMRANLLVSEGSRIYRDFGLKKGAGAFLGLYVFGHMVPALLHEAITRAIAGKFKKDDDDSDLGEIMSFFFGSQFREAASLVPVLGPVAVSTVNEMTRGNSGFGAPITTAPSVSMINTAAHTPGDFIKLLRDGTHGKEAIHDSLTLLGLLTGLPTAPLSRPIGYLSDVNSGKAEPSGPVDFTRGLLTGKPGK